MPVVAALFRDRDRALAAVRALQDAGFGNDTVLIASPTGAGEAARAAASRLQQPEEGFIDLGGVLGGQADPRFPDTERQTFEERVAEGDTMVRVSAPDGRRARQAEEILAEHGAERVDPGTIRD